VGKKIYLNKSDSVASAIDKVINAPDEEVVLYIPRGAEAARTKRDIELIKREAGASGKIVLVESVDDSILELAAVSGIRATNPFLGRSKHTVSDVVAVRSRRSGSAGGEVNIEVKHGAGRERGASKRVRVGGTVRIRDEAAVGGMKKVVMAVGVVAALTVVATLALVALPKVTISLALEKVPQGYIGALKVSPFISEDSVDSTMVQLGGVLLSKKKNITKSYPATGTDTVGRKAQGTVTVYNNFSTESQSLIKSTRLETPEGYIYRLDQSVVVPGAKKEGGTLMPSHIDVTVIADQPGEKYNIGPIPKFTIPGFRGTPKFEGFYGESKEPMRGGASGEVKMPTDEDIESARADIKKTLEDALKAEVLIDKPENIKILEGAYNFTATREQVDEVVDKNDEFNVTLYGEMSFIGFDEADLLAVLGRYFSEQSKKELMNFSYKIDYGEVTIDLKNSVMNSAINIESEWTEPFQKDEFKQKIAGMTENQLKEAVLSAPGVINGEIKMWPFWVNRVPKNLDRIAVDAS
jgi:hypothetical protein